MTINNLVLTRHTGAYTMDSIAATAFGFKLDSQADPQNEFLKNAADAFQLNLRNPIILLLGNYI